MERIPSHEVNIEMIIVAVIEAIVSLLIIRWLIKKKTGEPFSRKVILKILLFGAATAFIIMIASLFAPDGSPSDMSNPILVGFIDALTTAAMLEEGLKYGAFRLAMRNNAEARCRLDAVLVGALIAMGFALIEDVEYSIFGNFYTLIRAVLPLHAFFGTIMGYYYGKAKATGSMKYHILSLAIPILGHTFYDMWIVAIKRILDAAGAAADMLTEEELLALPYGEYLEPLGYVAVATIVVFFILIVTAFRKISQWSRNKELQESIVEQ